MLAHEFQSSDPESYNRRDTYVLAIFYATKQKAESCA